MNVWSRYLLEWTHKDIGINDPLTPSGMDASACTESNLLCSPPLITKSFRGTLAQPRPLCRLEKSEPQLSSLAHQQNASANLASFIVTTLSCLQEAQSKIPLASIWTILTPSILSITQIDFTHSSPPPLPPAHTLLYIRHCRLHACTKVIGKHTAVCAVAFTTTRLLTTDPVRTEVKRV